MRPLFLWSRRAFVAAAGQIGALQIIGGFAIGKAAVGEDGLSQVELLHAACAELSCAQSIGDACRRALNGGDPSGRRLSVELLHELRSAGHDCNSVAAISGSLREQSRRDFAAARIIFVDGWILSRTETRAYAIAS